MLFEFRTEIVPDGINARSAAREIHAAALFEVGGGLYSQVYSNDEIPYVIKIGRGTDFGYLAYLRTMHTLNISNRFLPRIFEAIFYQSENNVGVDDDHYTPSQDAFVVKMEKLKPGRRHESRNRTLFEKAVLFVADSFRGYNTEKKLSPELEEAITLVQLANEHAQKEMNSNGDRFDLHTGNFMLRKGQMVITDPLC